MPIPLGILAQAGRTISSGSYELITSTILTGSQSSVSFTNLGDYSTTYKHLQIRWTGRGSNSYSSSFIAKMQINSDTAANYAFHRILGNGSTVSSEASISQTYMNCGLYAGSGNTANVYGASVIDILDTYATKNKTIRVSSGLVGSGTISTSLNSGLWNSTSSVSSITITEISGGNFVSGSRFSLYGIKG